MILPGRRYVAADASRIPADRAVEGSLRKSPDSGAQGYHGRGIPESTGLGPYRW
jgi:hypothetical protein